MISKSGAEAQIDLIFKAMASAERIAFPKISLLTYGLLIFLIPAFEYGLRLLPWGGNLAIHLVLYGILFGCARELLIRKAGAWHAVETHPILTRALVGQQKFAAISATLSSVALAHRGFDQLVFPVLCFHVAALFYSFGKFSTLALKRMAYAQVLIAALAIEVMAQGDHSSLLPLFTTLLALTFVGGAYLK